jgi:hypothetical protein
MAHGKPQKQAVAIALSEAGKSSKDREPCEDTKRKKRGEFSKRGDSMSTADVNALNQTYWKSTRRERARHGR